jgi:hypothetical protein
MDINEKTEVAGIWFIDAGPTQGFDWMCTLYRQEGEPWRFTYRFRYHHPESGADPFKDKDEKSGATVSADGPEDEYKTKMLDFIQRLASTLSAGTGVEVDETLDVGVGAEALMAVLKDKPWAHIKSPVDLGTATKEADA